MTTPLSRRAMMTSGASLLGLHGLPPLPAVASTALDDDVVRLRPEIEPLVRLIEETPRNRVVEELAVRIGRGVSYQEVLAALYLATVRNVQPRPSVGFKFHCVLVISSAHLSSMAGPDADRWLPILWAADHFKGPQEEEKRKSGWRMKPVDESAVPPPHRARAAFRKAMEDWDVDAADAAAAGLARHCSSHEAFELFFRYGARDFRSIGHKIIFVSGAARLLQVIGWRHAEPVLRSLAFALLNHGGGGNPKDRDESADRPWRRHLEKVGGIRKEWRTGKVDDGATRDLLETLRAGSDVDATSKVLSLLDGGLSPRAIWDGVFASSGELLMRRTDIPSLHALTTMNAIRYAFATASDDETRRLLLLQAAAFVPLFRRNAGHPERRIDTLEPLEAKGPDDIFATGNKMESARKILGHLDGGGDPEALLDAARVLTFLKGTGAHDYKFSAAVLEDYRHLSPAWRNRFLAASVFYLKGSDARDNGLVARVRSALGG